MTTLRSITWGTWPDLSFEKEESSINNHSTQQPERDVSLFRKFGKEKQFYKVLHKGFESMHVYYDPPIELSEIRKQDMERSILEPGIDVTFGGLFGKRAFHKRQQILNIIYQFDLVYSIMRHCSPDHRVTVVEFCSSSGYVGLPIAKIFPDCKLILIDNRAKSIEIARERIKMCNLQNVELILGDIRDFNDSLDIGIGLHACGDLTDITQQKCIDKRAAYILCPCCVGKLKNSLLEEYPRSQTLRQMILKQEFEVIARAADFSHSLSKIDTEHDRFRRICKSWIERDRNLRAEEFGYSTRMDLIKPNCSTPKNDVLVGIPNEHLERISNSEDSQKWFLQKKDILNSTQSQINLEYLTNFLFLNSLNSNCDFCQL